MADDLTHLHHQNPRLRWVAALMILAVTAARIVYLIFFCPYDLAPDEAHYWDWSRHLDWSYYSKGPLIAWIIRAGCELFGNLSLSANGTLMPAVRIPAVLCGAGLLTGLYVLTYQTFRSDRLALGITLVALSMPAVALCSMIMTIDAPFLCLWCWALVFGRWAMVDGRRWAWPAAGLLVALGILAKYTMALWLLSAGLFLFFTPTHRRLLFQARFWLMVAVAALSALPVLYWNSQNDWVTFRHVAVQAGVVESKKSTGIRWFGPLEYAGIQFGVLLGFWFVVWLAAMVRFRPRSEVTPGIGYLWWMSAPTFVVFGLSSIRAADSPTGRCRVSIGGRAHRRHVLRNDSLVAAAATRRRRSRASRRCIGLLLTLLVHDTRMMTGLVARHLPEESPTNPTPLRSYDPAMRLKGARHMCANLTPSGHKSARLDGQDPILVGSRWDQPGLMGFYCDGHPQAYSFGLILRLDRHSQYDHWQPNPVDDAQAFRGRTLLVVGGGDPRAVDAERIRVGRRPIELVYREYGRAMVRWPVMHLSRLPGIRKAPDWQ